MDVVWSIDRAVVAAGDIVTAVRYTAALGDVQQSGEARLGPVIGEPIPYGELSREQMLDWLWMYVSKEATEARLRALVAEREAEFLPWESR